LTKDKLVPCGATRWRGFAARLALFAVLIQALDVQTHVHFDVDWHGLAAVSQGVGTSQQVGDPSQQPNGTNTDRCPLCQQQLSGGRTVVLDAASFVPPPNNAIFTTLAAEPLSSSFEIVSHGWHSRGPPSV
jgi:hypothetical protein